ncbi:hypothetical protein N177_1414 [Lutibaculum baratangense AMV1]|uniref:Uncharacterized protein n=1 Tax=Lutibaculum baratangense AMV1 TaxID=631454 RepID=V4RL96_9HYPH|nr:hypothetical protein N177_1414 [Lutibaculum baratangense AMV1]
MTGVWNGPLEITEFSGRRREGPAGCSVYKKVDFGPQVAGPQARETGAPRPTGGA